MYEQWIKLFCDFFLIREVKSTVERNPDAFEVHWANLDNVSSLLTLQDTIPTATGHASDVQKLGAVDHVIVC